jgi:hypothetical protein
VNSIYFLIVFNVPDFSIEDVIYYHEGSIQILKCNENIELFDRVGKKYFKFMKVSTNIMFIFYYFIYKGHL